MSIQAFLYILFIALLITLFFIHGLKNKGPWGTSWSFFTVLLLAMISAKLWFTPYGPHRNDVYWLPPILEGIIAASLLALATIRPPAPRIRSHELTREINRMNENIARSRAVYMKRLFWILVIILLMFSIIGIYK